MLWDKSGLSKSAKTRVTAVLALCVGLSGCFQPLYGPALLGGPTRSALDTIDVAPIPDRVGHFLRTSLQFEFGGGTLPTNPDYRLEVAATPSTRVAVVDRGSVNADSASVFLAVNFRLLKLADNTVVTEGRASATASYDRVSQRFTNLRVGRDAEERAAKVVSDQIRIRVAAALAALPH